MKKKLSIITPSYNQGSFILDCINSVKNQNYENIEHIIIDGGSTDTTLEILKKTNGIKWISEPDKGPANAINKGFRLATGEVFGWLNSDDYFKENTLGDVMEIFNANPEIKIIIGNINFVDENKNLIVETKSDEMTLTNLIHKSADIIRQPSTFFDRDLFWKVGGIDEKYKCAFDYDLFIKLFKISKPYYLDKLIAYTRDYPSTISRTFIKKQGWEIIKIALKNGAKLYDKIVIYNLVRKIFGIR
ncbi:MAG: glycosyltransferase [Ignavibacteria bacterium]|nr:glycosyltransferase [Ignavibacteria bacterium]